MVDVYYMYCVIELLVAPAYIAAVGVIVSALFSAIAVITGTIPHWAWYTYFEERNWNAQSGCSVVNGRRACNGTDFYMFIFSNIPISSNAVCGLIKYLRGSTAYICGGWVDVPSCLCGCFFTIAHLFLCSVVIIGYLSKGATTSGTRRDGTGGTDHEVSDWAATQIFAYVVSLIVVTLNGFSGTALHRAIVDDDDAEDVDSLLCAIRFRRQAEKKRRAERRRAARELDSASAQ